MNEIKEELKSFIDQKEMEKKKILNKLEKINQDIRSARATLAVFEFVSPKVEESSAQEIKEINNRRFQMCVKQKSLQK